MQRIREGRLPGTPAAGEDTAPPTATLALLGGCGTLCVARRGHRRYRGSLANHAVVSGDEFLKIKQHDTLHAAAEAATEAAKRAPDE